jgi:hypothetical protein
MPLLVNDEAKTEECGNVIMLSLLERSGILEVQAKDTKNIRLADIYESKW